MIVMINGAFGVGKTTVANLLTESIPNSMLYDPEAVGYMLRYIIPDGLKRPEERADNSQDLELWKILAVQVAKHLKQQYRQTLIVPMTIFNKAYLQFIVEGFKEFDRDIYHFCLTADEETIYARLRARGEEEGNWCYRQTSKCLDAYRDECFREYIQTEGVCAEEVAATIRMKISAAF